MVHQSKTSTFPSVLIAVCTQAEGYFSPPLLHLNSYVQNPAHLACILALESILTSKVNPGTEVSEHIVDFP